MAKYTSCENIQYRKNSQRIYQINNFTNNRQKIQIKFKNYKLEFYRTNCHTGHETTCAVTSEVAELIETVFNIGVTKPSSIMTELREILDLLEADEPRFTLPSRRQLYYEVKKIKLKKFGDTRISLGDLRVMIEQQTDIPDDEKTTFVFNYQIGAQTNIFVPNFVFFSLYYCQIILYFLFQIAYTLLLILFILLSFQNILECQNLFILLSNQFILIVKISYTFVTSLY